MRSAEQASTTQAARTFTVNVFFDGADSHPGDGQASILSGGTLTTLRSRHTPVAVSADKKLEAYGLTGDPLRLFINVDDKEHTLTFGEEPAHNNRFTRATWLRLVIWTALGMSIYAFYGFRHSRLRQ